MFQEEGILFDLAFWWPDLGLMNVIADENLEFYPNECGLRRLSKRYTQ
jgi:hypothetical protein